MILGRALRRLKKKAVEGGKILWNTKREGNGQDQTSLSSSSMASRISEVVPQRAIEDFWRFYSREYRKYDTVKEMRKSIRFLTREEFAYRRASILTLCRLLARERNGRHQKSILDLVQHEDLEKIEERLRQLK
jgi:hypothetical protein